MKKRNIFKRVFTGLMLGGLVLGSTYSSAQTFTKRIGDDNDNEGATAVISDGNGNVIIAGYRENNSVLLSMAPDGTINWQDEFEIITTGNKRDIISDIEMINGTLYACGYGDDLNGTNDDAFVFSYTPNAMGAGTFNWTQIDPGTANTLTRYYSLTPYQGNIMITGTVNSTNTDGYIRMLSTAGALITTWSQRAGTTNQADDFLFAETDGGNYYYGGRVFRGGASLCNSRSMMASINAAGALAWSNAYFQTAGGSQRMYGQDLAYDATNNELVLAATGSVTTTGNCNPTNYETYVTRTDLTGTPIVDRHLVITGYDDVIAREIAPVNGGYLVMGQARISGAGDIFLMQLNQNLEIQWTRIYDGGNHEDFASNSNNQLLVDQSAGYAYIVGRSNSYGSGATTDMVVYKTDLSGFIGDDCQVDVVSIDDLLGRTVEAFTWTNITPVNLDGPSQVLDINHQVVCSYECGCIANSATPGNAPAMDHGLTPEEDLDQGLEENASTGIGNHEFQKGLHVFPNPAQQLIEVQTMGIDQAKTLTVTSVTGTVLLSVSGEQALSQPLDISGLENGTYFITLTSTTGEEYTKSFVKQN